MVVANILDYVKWRGDLRFSERPFCLVDNLVFSELAYLDFQGIVPTVEDGGFCTIREAAASFYQQGRGNTCGGGPSGEFLQLLADSRRFGEVSLSHFSQVADADTQTDFCALHMEMEDGQVYVAFRGTSDSLLGWREDFSISFQLMPSQKLEAEYLSATLEEGISYRVGGHSKGGNLAVYAALMLPEKQQRLVTEIYSNDGPGLCPELLDRERYQTVSHKLTRIVPEFCVIGALFQKDEPTVIVRSSASGFHQHDGATWQVEGDRFVTCSALSQGCTFVNQVFDQWIESADMEQRRVFTRDFFDALEAGGAKKRTDLSQGGFDEFESILLSVIRSERKTKIVIGKFFRSFVSAFRNVQFASLFREKETLQGAALFLIGLFFAIAPAFAAQCIGVGVAVAGILWLGKKQFDLVLPQHREEPNAKAKLLVNIVLLCLLALLVGQGSLLLYFSNYVTGGFFLLVAYRWARRAFRKDLPVRSRAIQLAFAVVCFFLGMVPILSARLVLEQYVFVAGTFLVLYGAGKIVHAMYENGKKQ